MALLVAAGSFPATLALVRGLPHLATTTAVPVHLGTATADMRWSAAASTAGPARNLPLSQPRQPRSSGTGKLLSGRREAVCKCLPPPLHALLVPRRHQPVPQLHVIKVNLRPSRRNATGGAQTRCFLRSMPIASDNCLCRAPWVRCQRWTIRSASSRSRVACSAGGGSIPPDSPVPARRAVTSALPHCATHRVQ